VEAFLDRLAGMPVPALYVALAVVAALENVFPPVPADTVVAFGSFLAARGQGTALGVFISTWAGNVGGAMLIYWVGRRYGAERLEQRLLGDRAAEAETRIKALYKRYGLAALFISRFLPGVRAIVPPLAGALRIPAIRTAVAMGAASAVWYGAISYLAFRIGADWEQLSSAVGRYGRGAALAGAALAVIVGAAIWVLARRRRAAHR
jgi:membrane protein DedA with SNARE-associated domain